VNAKDTIVRAMNRSKREGGLRIIISNDALSKSHLQKADHNLIVMTDLSKLEHEDWVVISAYYAMYQSATALLKKIGLESKDHATTTAVLEYFFGSQISKDLIEKFNSLKEKKDKLEAITIEEKYINYLWKAKQTREALQYGVSIGCKESEMIMKHAREVVSKIKLVIDELDEKIIGVISTKIRDLQGRKE